jgi:hypothetical protein
MSYPNSKPPNAPATAVIVSCRFMPIITETIMPHAHNFYSPFSTVAAPTIASSAELWLPAWPASNGPDHTCPNWKFNPLDRSHMALALVVINDLYAA